MSPPGPESLSNPAPIAPKLRLQNPELKFPRKVIARLGQKLIEMGAARVDQIAAALTAQRHDPRPLGELLVHMGVIDQETLERALAGNPDPSPRGTTTTAGELLSTDSSEVADNTPEHGPTMQDGDRSAGVAPADVVAGLQGHTHTVSIPEILGFIAHLGKTGTLTVYASAEVFFVQLEEGSLVYAQGDNSPKNLLLGEILVSQGALERDVLENLLQDEGRNSLVLGRTLLEKELVSEQALRIALSYQIQQVIHRMYATRDAAFRFDDCAHVLEGEDLRLNVISLLLESARSLDEFTARGAAQKDSAAP